MECHTFLFLHRLIAWIKKLILQNFAGSAKQKQHNKQQQQQPQQPPQQQQQL